VPGMCRHCLSYSCTDRHHLPEQVSLHRVRKEHWARIISAATEYDTAITLAQLEDANRKVRAATASTWEPALAPAEGSSP
jgi:hypothetical protein